jgi:hypothetical protein
MSEDHLEREVLGEIGMDRRSFVKKLVLGAAFAVPVISSFDMLTSSIAAGVAPTCTSSNATAPSGASGSGLQGGAGGSRRPGKAACGGSPGGGLGGSSFTGNGSVVSSDRNSKTDVAPVVWSLLA